jgi:hypothetical protein
VWQRGRSEADETSRSVNDGGFEQRGPPNVFNETILPTMGGSVREVSKCDAV